MRKKWNENLNGRKNIYIWRSRDQNSNDINGSKILTI